MNYPYNLSLHRYKLTFQLPENMDAKNFFGSKLRGILGAVLEKTNPNKVGSFDVLSQVHLLKPDGKITELDLLIMVNNRVFWFECKAGDVGRHYDLFKRHRNLLGPIISCYI